jgi:hypothetical protein
MNFDPYFPYFLTDLGQIRHKISPANAVKQIWVPWKSVQCKPHYTDRRNKILQYYQILLNSDTIRYTTRTQKSTGQLAPFVEKHHSESRNLLEGVAEFLSLFATRTIRTEWHSVQTST